MNSTFLKKALPHLIAIGIFLIVAVVYCRPVLQGKVVNQSDVQQYKAMAQQSFEYKEKYGHFPLWTESTFGGMPTYTIAMDGTTVVSYGYLTYFLTLGLPQPICFFFLACVCFYILMAVLRINPWISVLASLAYAYCSYDPVIIATGHVTKMWAIGYAPGVVAGLLLLLDRRQYLWGTGLLAFFLAAQIGTQHLQIVYYTLISMGLLSLFYVIQNARQGRIKDMAIALGLAAVACGIGYGTSVGSTLPLQEYTKETMRGGRTELSSGTSMSESNGGLSKTYAFGWSYGIGETLTLAVPDSYGGGSANKSVLGDNSKTADRLSQDLSFPEDAANYYANAYAYWGPQPGTSGPVYLGAVICFLCIFGLVLVKGWPKWWLLSTIVLGIVLAWGDHFAAFNYFIFDHFPYYNKFRSPSTALFLPQLAAPILAAFALNQLLSGSLTNEQLWKKFKTTSYIAGTLLVLLIGAYFTLSYSNTGADSDIRLRDQMVQRKLQILSQGGGQAGADAQQQAFASGTAVIKALQEDRQSVFGADMIRTIVLVGVAAVLLGLYIRKKINPVVFLAGMLVLSSYDLLAVSARYLNQDNYVDQSDFEAVQNPTQADQQIKADPDKNYRVFDESASSPFENSRASYFHNSLGGYSPAKLGLYQDLIEHQLAKGNMQVYNMLNTKYFIQPDQRTGQPVARLNPSAFGPCWLVKGIHYVKDGDEEMKALDSINLRDTVVIQQKYASQVKSMPVPDTTASIRLVDNLNEKIDYKFSAKTPQFAVFSEIYYDKGWDAYLDGNKSDYLRVNYLLRGMPVPAGDHTIEFRFEPHSYKVGMMLNMWFSLAIYVLLIAGLVLEWKKRNPNRTTKA